MNSTGTVVSIYGNKATIRVASSTALLKAIPIVGDASSIAVGSRVPLQTIDNRVVVIAEGGGSTTIVAAPSSASNNAGLAAHLLDPNAHPQYAAKAQTETITGIWTLGTSTPLRFRDAALAILSSANGQLDIDADVAVEVTSPTIELAASTKIAAQTPLFEFDQAAQITSPGHLGITASPSVSVTASIMNFQSSTASTSIYFGNPSSTCSFYIQGASVKHNFYVDVLGILHLRMPNNRKFSIENDNGSSYIAEFAVSNRITKVYDLNVDTAVTTPKIDTASGDLTLAPVGDLILDPAGAQVIAAAGVTLQSEGFVSQTTGWAVDSDGNADFRNIYADQLVVDVFSASNYQVLSGAMILTKSRAQLSRDFVIPTNAATGTLYVTDLEGFAGTAVFATNDIVRLRYIDFSQGGLVVADVWGVVTGYTDLDEGEQSWTFTTSDDGGVSGSTVYTGAVALDYGQAATGSRGTWEATVLDAIGAPYSQVQTWATNPWTPANYTTHVRLGNLKGITGVDEYGLFAGRGVTAGDAYLLATDTTVQLHNLDMAFYDEGNNQRLGIDVSAGAAATDKLFWAGPSSSDPRFVIYGDGSTWLSSLALSPELSDQFFSKSDGLLLLGPYDKITTTTWTSQRGQTATISGAFHQVAGPWPGTRALMVEEATTNLIVDPVLGVGSASWAAYGATISRDADQSRYEGYALKVVTAGGVYDGATYTPDITVSASETYTASVWVYCGTAGVPMRLSVELNSTGWLFAAFTSAVGWQRVVNTFATGAADTAVVNIRVQNNNNATVHTYYVDMLQLEKKTRATSDCYGGLSWCAWSGTAHASTSTRTTTEVNLDAHATMLSGRDTATLSLVAQMPYDADGTWLYATATTFFDTAGADNNNRVRLAYNSTAQAWDVYINGATRISSGVQSFSAADWLHLVLTLDFSANSYALYINGTLDGTSTAALTAPILTQMNVGTSYTGGNESGAAYAEYAVFGSVLTAEQVAALYHRNAPLADAGAMDTPGIYILDGKFSLATSTSGARTQIDTAGWWAYDADGDAAFGLSLQDSKSWGGFTINKSDLVLGHNKEGSSAILWDQSTGKFGFYGDAVATAQIEINTDGSLVAGGGVVTLDVDGITLAGGSSDPNRVKWYASGNQVMSINGYVLDGNNHGLFTVSANAVGTSKYSAMWLTAVGSGAGANAEIKLASKVGTTSAAIALAIHGVTRLTANSTGVTLSGYLSGVTLGANLDANEKAITGVSTLGLMNYGTSHPSAPADGAIIYHAVIGGVNGLWMQWTDGHTKLVAQW